MNTQSSMIEESPPLPTTESMEYSEIQNFLPQLQK